MAMPNTLKLFNLFGDGNSFIDQCLELSLPKIAMKVEDYAGAGMFGPVGLVKGLEKLEFEHTYNSPIEAIVQTFGVEKHDAALLRFMGSYSDEGTGGDRAVRSLSGAVTTNWILAVPSPEKTASGKSRRTARTTNLSSTAVNGWRSTS